MELKEIFSPGGLIDNQLKKYEFRIQQLEMATAVSEAFRDSTHLIVEAGTGVGKSFAYLIPAIDFAISKSERVVVSTNTISLQEQLINKDIPFLQKILPYDFKAVLVKGRSNYLCERRLENLITYERELFESKDEVDDLTRIHQWSAETEDGSLSDLNPQPKMSVWNRVCSERDTCLGPAICPHAKKCFYQKARNKIFNAHVLIVNHHLLFSDLSLRKNAPGFSVLPGYKYLVIDEAHNIENVATEHIGISLSKFSVRYLLDSICNRDKKGGLLVRLGEISSLEYVDKARKEIDTFFDNVQKWAEDEQSGTKRIREPNFVENTLDLPLKELESLLKGLIPSAKNDEEEKEITAYAERCQKTREELNIILSKSIDDSVYWVEVSRDRFVNITLNNAPINVASELRPNLFDAMTSVIMTGATLSTNQNFDYFKKRLGINTCREIILGSPFDYSKQVKIYIPKNMPDPQNNGAFVSAVIEKSKYFIKLTEGKAFLLFTSYKMMDEVYKALKSWLDEQGINSFVQGEGLSRHIMLEKFRDDVNSVLFGTSSFWEGVDVQGEALSNVIVVKLPFSVPTHPVVEARIEDIQNRGGNPFMEYNLPEAIIKLKQGFGRLIRTKNDSGIVVILDPRVKTKFYGKSFINSLPKCEIINQ
ncbi:TPA: DEAD/DEAH box helicase [bacterium]|nr:DEAD/DEAH box helicase [bacterium]